MKGAMNTNTARQFESTRLITADQVIATIKRIPKLDRHYDHVREATQP